MDLSSSPPPIPPAPHDDADSVSPSTTTDPRSARAQGAAQSGQLPSALEAASSVAEAAFLQSGPGHAHASPGAVRHAAWAAALATEGVRGNTRGPACQSPTARPRRRGASGPRSGIPSAVRATRHAITLGVKLKVIEAHESGRSYPNIQATVVPFASLDNLSKIWQRRAQYKALAAQGTRLGRTSGRGSNFSAVDRRLHDWFLLLSRRGRKRIPFTVSLLQEKARRLADEPGVTGFTASRGFVQGWARRHNVANVVLHGAGGSVNVAEAEQRIAAIREELQHFDAENIFNMDETGLIYRCLPKRSYVPAEQRRVARGTKAMKAKERVTLVLACNATGSPKKPVAVIGKAACPLCFRPPGCESPLPYLNQKNCWMDGVVLKRWMEEVFLPYVRSCINEKVVLIVDNLASHADFEEEQVLIISLPPSTTALFQPLDAGVIQALKMRYKRRLLAHTVVFLERIDEHESERLVRSAVANTGRVSLLDVTRIIHEEWAGTTAESLARCWIMVKCLPAPMEAAITISYVDYHASDSPQVCKMTAEITVALQRATLTDGLLPGTRLRDVQSGVSSWLRAEAGPEILDDTIDMVLAGGESEGEGE